jgi:hypothetical protein
MEPGRTTPRTVYEGDTHSPMEPGTGPGLGHPLLADEPAGSGPVHLGHR